MKITRLQRTDVLIAHVPTGNLPFSRAKQLLDEVKGALARTFPRHKSLVIADPGGKTTVLEIVRPNP